MDEILRLFSAMVCGGLVVPFLALVLSYSARDSLQWQFIFPTTASAFVALYGTTSLVRLARSR